MSNIVQTCKTLDNNYNIDICFKYRHLIIHSDGKYR